MVRINNLEFQNDNANCGKPCRTEKRSFISFVRETIEINLPNDLSYLNYVTSFLVERTVRFGIAHAETFEINLALDEAITNAIKHGNKEDASKSVYVRAEISVREARFIIRDQGGGFDPAKVPDPRVTINRFKPSGRGILLMRNLMDEVTMIKYPGEVAAESCKAA